jgi:hypothetical protein
MHEVPKRFDSVAKLPKTIACLIYKNSSHQNFAKELDLNHGKTGLTHPHNNEITDSLVKTP